LFIFETNDSINKLASRLIKNLPVPLGTLVRKRVPLKLAALNNVPLHHLTSDPKHTQELSHATHHLTQIYLIELTHEQPRNASGPPFLIVMS
jgi:hypothetical protein